MRRLVQEFITKEAIGKIAVMLLGTCILAFAYFHINFANHLSEGGFVGLALLGKYAFGLSPAWSVFLLDIPVLIVAWVIKGRKFTMFALLGAGAFSLFYTWFERYSPLVIDLHGNMAAASLLSGLLTGFGAGIVLRFGGATGGDDILSLLISQWKGWKLGTVFFALDSVVLLLSLCYLPLRETLYTVFAVWVAGKIVTLTVTLKIRKPKLDGAKAVKQTPAASPARH